MKLLIYILTFLSYSNALAKELVYVQALWRHGDRAPDQLPYPLDNYTEDYWEKGWGQLTNMGIQELFDLGVFFADRYTGNLVNSSYNHNEIYVRSSDVDRTLASAQSFLNGMFPPTGYEQWNPKINWQPIPVHANTPNTFDPLLNPAGVDCPKYDDLWNNKYNPLITDEIQQKYGPVFKMLEETTGYSNDLIIKKAMSLNDINQEMIHNLTQPEWITMEWLEYDNNSTLDIITEIYRLRRTAQFKSPDLAKLRGGVIVRDFIDRLLDASKGIFNEATKMILYSGHDNTFFSLMYNMGIGDHQVVPHAAAVIFELYRDTNDEYTVEILYKKNDEITQLTVPGCDRVCEVQKFHDLLKDQTYSSPEKMYDDCGTNTYLKLISKNNEATDRKSEILDSAQNASRQTRISFYFLLIIYIFKFISK